MTLWGTGQQRYSATRKGGKVFGVLLTPTTMARLVNTLFGQSQQAGRYQVRLSRSKMLMCTTERFLFPITLTETRGIVVCDWQSFRKGRG